MLGAIIGDIIGSTYEFNPIKSKEFELFSPGSRPTDDTVMTVAVGLVTAASDCTDEERYRQDLIRFMRLLGREYPDAGYGKRFIRWLNEGNGAAYHSYGNGSAMRVSPVGWRARTLAEAEQLARWSAEVTHDHPDGIRGAQAVASAIFLARTTHDKKRIRGHIASYYYPMEFRLDRIRASYRFDATCPGSVPQAIVCFLESTGYEDAVRNAVSLGGDADTQACIAGAIAEAYYGIPADIQRQGLSYLDSRLSRLFLAYATRLYPQKSG
ncbi:MAG: ADP-ribosylglycohydrolase [Clostridiales bacterium]|nr:ADP-ribosylglycohydrolase [Clostridiales bacterium]